LIRNYIVITLRNILRHKTFSLINIIGLTLGIACALIILIWVNYEFSFDKYHKNIKNLYFVYLVQDLISNKETSQYTSGPLAEDLNAQFPQIINTCRMGRIQDVLFHYQPTDNPVEDIKIIEQEVMMTDSTIFKMFTHPFTTGNPENALTDPFSIVLTEELANKYFGKENPLGKIIRLFNKYDMKVTGVIKNVPDNTHFKFKSLVPVEFAKKTGWEFKYDNNFVYTFLQLENGIDYKELNKKINEEFISPKTAINREYWLESMSRLHLHGYQYPQRIIFIMVFLTVGIAILIIACINYLSLTTARLNLRAKEVGIRKTTGASRRDLIYQFIGESILLAIIALNFAIIIAHLALPLINRLTNSAIHFRFADINTLLILLGILIFVGIISGSYPAFILSAINPIISLKGGIIHANNKAVFRKTFVIFQFTFSVIAIINIISTQKQMIFMNDLGFNKKNVLYCKLRGNIYEDFKVIRNDLLENPMIKEISCASDLPVVMFNRDVNWGLRINDINPVATIASVSYDYRNTFEFKMKAGRFFSRDYPTDKNAVVINEYAVKELGLVKPVGEKIYFNEKKYNIIGVIQDFHFIPKVMKITPLILFLQPEQNNYAFIKINPPKDHTRNDIAKINDFIHNTIDKYNPEYPHEFLFLDKFELKEQKNYTSIIELTTYFAIIGIIISCIGLFGLSSFLTEQRTKEIGVRKVMGASAFNLTGTLSKEYLKLWVISVAIAIIFSYFGGIASSSMMAYVVDTGILHYIIITVITLIIVILTVGYQTIKTAIKNPVESLRYE
jgi:putative ABC transport system permease protein